MSETILTPDHWLVLTNPTAGKRQFAEQSKFVKSALDRANIPYIFRVTEYSGHAIDIAHSYTKRGCLNFLILGGDGTVSEVINGIFSAAPNDTSAIRIGVLPRGTGNDWARFWKLRKNDKQSMKVFLQGKTKTIDVGKLDYNLSGCEQTTTRFFINSVGFGLDAEVVAIAHRMKKYMGSFSLIYAVALVWAIFRYKSRETILRVNGASLSLKLFTMNIANGPYSGGGIKQNPQAKPYDGIFDLMLVEKPTLRTILSALPLIFSNKLAAHRAIRPMRAKEIAIHTQAETPVEADGIIVPHAHNYQVSILPEAIRMIVP